MIIPCINSTFFVELGGNFALVFAGKFLVGCPGAPGCTTTGGDNGSPFCPNAVTDKKHTNAKAAASPPRNPATPVTGRNLGLTLKGNNCIEIY
jgi:hypothetical protein